MNTQIIDRSGVLMQVSYEEGRPATPDAPAEPITFHSVFVLDGDYRPTGPDILPLLDGMTVMISPSEATPFFCTVDAELMVTS
jgi:hypothetical protein